MAKPSNTSNLESSEAFPGGQYPDPLRGLDGRSAPPPAPMTYERFLDWADEDTHAEWVDGEIVLPSPANARHQFIGAFLSELIGIFVRMHQLGAVMQAPFQMKLARSGREPDVLYIAAAHLDRLKQTYLDGPADLAVEIVSPDSVERDHRDKLAEYQEAGIPEYWLIDPLTDQADFYQLDAVGQYQPIAADASGSYHSKVLPGFWLRVAWLAQDPLPDPDPARALFAIDRAGYTAYLQRVAESPDM
jgi:Uma2 family endonuclease